MGIVCIVLAVLLFVVHLARNPRQEPEQQPQDVTTTTGVIEGVEQKASGNMVYGVRLTGQYNQSYVVKGEYAVSPNGRYEDGKLVDIYYWVTPTGAARLQIVDPELTFVPPAPPKKSRLWLILSVICLVAGIVLLIV